VSTLNSGHHQEYGCVQKLNTTLNSGHHQEYGCVQKLNTTSWKSPPFTLKTHSKGMPSAQLQNRVQKGQGRTRREEPIPGTILTFRITHSGP